MASIEQPLDSMFQQQTHENSTFLNYYPDPSNRTFGPGDVAMNGSYDSYPAGSSRAENFVNPLGFDPSLFVKAPATAPFINAQQVPNKFAEDAMVPSPNMSSASGPSETSSATGSPQSHHDNIAAREWNPAGLGVRPAIVGNDYVVGAEYTTFTTPMIEDLAFDYGAHAQQQQPPKGFVDPSLINPEMNLPITMPPPYETHFQHSPMYSPSGSSTSPQPNVLRTSSSSPFQKNQFQPSFPNSPYMALMDHNSRRQSMATFASPGSGEYVSGDDMREKHRCTYPDCGKVFKDLKAHLLTHQSSRPEKCPITSCEYHFKGFARKYDKNRHTLTHYKGNMVCGFCSGAGSAKEKTFNRADVFKRHLMSVHGVEQTPPNSRKKITTSSMSTGSKLAGYPADATGKCSTCSQTFANAQDFYEHLDECVLRIVQQEDPAEEINKRRLAEVENDADLHETLEKHDLPKDPYAVDGSEGTKDEDDAMSDIEEAIKEGSARVSPTVTKTGPANGIQKSKGLTHSRNGVKLSHKRKNRKNNEDNPKAWGIDNEHLVWKKRVICSFDGARRLHKDELMYHTENEIRTKTLSDGKSYVTDLDYYTLSRAEGMLGATEEEKGPWVSDDPTEEQREEMRQLQQQKDQDTVREMFESGTQPGSA